MADNYLNKDRPSSHFSFFKSLILCVISSILLVLSFPRFDIWIFAWIGLIPFFLSLDGSSAKRAFFLGYILGVMFFAGTLYWLVHVTFLGAALLVLYLALYFALFALAYKFFCNHSIGVKLVVLPSCWVALEFIRGHLLTGFGWASLCHTQYKNLFLIQAADITGMLGISFLIVMVNFLGKELIESKQRLHSLARETLAALIVVVFVLGSILGYGVFRLNQDYPSGETIKIAVIQGNIPQEMKWKRRDWPVIMQKYLDLTSRVAGQNPDLIIWPESSFPGFLWEAPKLFEDLKSFVAELKIPVVVGAVTRIGEDYHNSAFLISAQGDVIKRYDKIHLVPFGEYIPSRKLFPFLAHLVPIADFTPGKEYTIFPGFPREAAQDGKKTFSVLICFEDTLSEIAREFSLRGAGLLVNITNDAWFKDTSEPFMHLQNSIFRTIENRKGLVRSANTGVSGFIDSRGRIYEVLKNAQGKSTYVDGYTLAEVNFNHEKTFYTKFGDVFTYLCFGCILFITISTRRRSISRNYK